jgi:CheY-like chemotaxis protein
VTERILQQAGARVFCAEDGQEALELLFCLNPDEVDLVLMDIEMPVMDGAQACKKIRCNPLWKAVPVVASTACSAEEIQSAYPTADFSGVLSKPFSTESLCQCILAFG